MNILMALSQLEVTGAEVYACTVADALIERGHNVYLMSDTLTVSTKGKYTKLEFNKRSLKNRFKQVMIMYKFIKQNNIQVVHAHSRASAWISNLACKLARIPMITTVHGRQPVHFSRKLFKGFGDYTFAVCENIAEHLKKDLGVREDKIEVLRNGIQLELQDEKHRNSTKNQEDQKIKLSLIGRLSGPKGDVAYKILNEVIDFSKYSIEIMGNKDIPKRFEKFKDRINFLGYVSNISQKMLDSDIIIGAGRVAIEGLILEKNVISIGEAKTIGLITNENIKDAMASNFGDIGVAKGLKFDIDKLKKDLSTLEIKFQSNTENEERSEISKLIKKEYALNDVVERLEKKYQNVYINKKKYEVPILMYHRVIADKSEAGVHGTYVTTTQFENHMKILKRNNYDVITFKEYLNGNYKNRFNKKQIIITFDDGYKDNYKNAFPILKKYNFKAVIFLVSSLSYNRWDTDVTNAVQERKLSLMDRSEILEMQKYGIEFGGHTKTHIKLGESNIDKCREEIIEGTKILEEFLGETLATFAYPYGSLNSDVKQIVLETGYNFAVATDSGSVCLSDDLYEIRRIGIFPNITNFGFKRKITGRYNFKRIAREKKGE